MVARTRLAAGGVRSGLDFLDLLSVGRVAAAGCGRVALSGEGEALLAAELVCGRFFSRIARCACGVLLDAGLVDAVLLAGGDGMDRRGGDLASVCLVGGKAERGNCAAAGG